MTVNAVEQINAYPFWGPANAGPARNFAAPYYVVGQQVTDKLKDLPVNNKIPQETQYRQVYVQLMQLVPAFVALPQAPVQSRDPFAQARSLLDYASQSLGSSNIGQSDNRGA